MIKLYSIGITVCMLLVCFSCKHVLVTVPRAGLPEITTKPATAITNSTATSGGEVTSEGGFVVTERGVCWATTSNPTTANAKTINGAGAGSFESFLVSLSPNTQYFVRAYATNANGTAYGNEVTFTTLNVAQALPNVSTSDATYNAASGNVQTGGNVTYGGTSAVTARGVCWSTSANPTIAGNKTADGSGTGAFSSTIAGLSTNTTYYMRAYATNSTGTAYGDNKTVTVPAPGSVVVPTVTTAASTYNSTGNSISSGGNVTADGGAAVTARGVCWGTSANPTIAGSKTTDGSGTGTFASTITSLTANTTYYIRAYATNSAGTAYGNEVSVSTSTPSGFTIGQSYGGGVIFYLDGTGQHGLIAASNDVGSTSGTKWDYNSNTALIGATSSTDGKANTNAIVAALGTTQTYAARVCVTYSSGGFTDWFLPSRSQLQTLYSQRGVVGNFNTSSGEYWSSTEDDKDKAWMVRFDNGGVLKDENKDKALLVRPIRAF